MARVVGQRRQQGKQVLQEQVAEIGHLALGQVVVGQQADTLVGQFGQQVLQQAFVLLVAEIVDHLANQVQLVFRGPSLQPQVGHSRSPLPLQATDPFADELVEVRAGDAEELEAFRQRIARILGFVQDPPVEVEPTQLAVVDFGCRTQILHRAAGHVPLQERRVCRRHHDRTGVPVQGRRAVRVGFRRQLDQGFVHDPGGCGRGRTDSHDRA